ncbi:hypothetical protein GYMLUDRAFT_55396 [Collybiopsis luxurians FD-317 M1]|nr:hypothetical protein GYMLUDRAFT_55396 [Collybiopsis luxurians FD-317 M1]
MKRKSSFSDEKSRKKGTFDDKSNLRSFVERILGSIGKSSDSYASGATTLTGFSGLLDFSDQDNIETRANKIAEQIIHSLVLVLKSKSEIVAVFEVLELEFYLWQVGVHEDPFTHRAVEQAESGKWYFHRVPQRSGSQKTAVGSGYRGGSRKGLDITIGQPAITSSPYFSTTSKSGIQTRDPTRGGILLRTLRNTSTGKVVSGPSLIVDEILKLSQASKISELVDEKWMGNISVFRGDSSSAEDTDMLYLKLKTDIEAKLPVIYQSPRIGLDPFYPGVSLTPSHPRVAFSTKLYRYFIHPALLTSNGRPQTFLGVLSSLNPIFPSPGTTINEGEMTTLKNRICEQSGMKIQTVAKYLEYYLDGLKDRSNLESFTRATKKQASASPATYLQLMGILSAVGESF